MLIISFEDVINDIHTPSLAKKGKLTDSVSLSLDAKGGKINVPIKVTLIITLEGEDGDILLPLLTEKGVKE